MAVAVVVSLLVVVLSLEVSLVAVVSLVVSQVVVVSLVGAAVGGWTAST